MTQRQAVYPGQEINDDVMNRAATSLPGVCEGFTPLATGIGGGAGWQVSLNPSDRGISIWRTIGLAEKGHVTIEEDLPVILTIDPPDTTNPRIDVIVGVHRWVAPELDAYTGFPDGVFLPAQEAHYTVIKGTPAAVPEIPTLPIPTSGGDTATPLFRINVGKAADNSCLVEPWDPCDWTYGRRAIHHVATFEATNPLTSAAATGTLTSNATAPGDSDTVTIGTKTYTFKTALTPIEGEVLIGANAAAALANLKYAINHTGTPGTNYQCAAAHPTALAGALTSTTLVVTAIASGTAGNSIVTTVIVAAAPGGGIATTETAVTLSWDALTLAGTTATDTLYMDEGTPPNDGDTITLGTKVYKFKITLTPTEGQVLIGGSTSSAAANLKSAVNHTGTPGTDYSCAAAHPTVLADTITLVSTQRLIVFNAITPGTAGNLIHTAASNGLLDYWPAFSLYGGAAGGTLTSTGTSPSDGDTVTVDTKVYTFKTVLTPTEGEVLIGASAAGALINLKSAINHTGTPGTDYSCAAAHPTALADAFTSTTVHVIASGSSAILSWAHGTLTGGSNGGDAASYAFGVVDTTSDLIGFDYADLTLVANRTGEYLVQFTSMAIDEQATLSKKSTGEGAFTVISDRIGRITEIVSLKQGDEVVVGGNGGSGTMTGQIQFLGWSDRKFVLDDPANSFTITNVDVTELGDTTFPHTFTLPITTAGDTPPIVWQILAGTDLPLAVISGSDVVATMSNYGTWTLKLYGKDSIGKTARKVLRITKLPSAAVITNPVYLVLSSAAGENWSSTPGDTYGYLITDTGFTKAITITSTGGLAPFSYFANIGANLLDPQVNHTTGGATIFFPAAAQVYPNPTYVGQQVLTVNVTGAFGTFGTATINAYAPRVHAHDSGSNWRRTAPNRVKVAKTGAANFLLTLYTGSPSVSQFQTNHTWAVVGGGTTLPGSPTFAGSPVANHADLSCTGWPSTYGTYTLEVTATVTVAGGTGSTGSSTENLIIEYVPHGALGLTWGEGAYPVDGLGHARAPSGGYLFRGAIASEWAVWFGGKWWVWMADTVDPITNGPKLYSSASGTTWALETQDLNPDPLSPVISMVVAGSTLVAFGQYVSGTVHLQTATSTDGHTWTTAPSNPPGFGPVVYADTAGVFMSADVLTGFVYRSTDGISWTHVATIPGGAYNGATGIGTDGTIFVIVGRNSVSVSSDSTGTSWTTTSIPTANWGPPHWLKSGLWVIAGGGNNVYLTSPDGVVWTVRYLPISYGAYGSTSCTGDLLVIANGTAYATTSDGIHWEQFYATVYGLGALSNNGINFLALGAFPTVSS